MKFLNYTYKQLNLFLLLMAVFVLLLIYRQTIVPTFNLYRECGQMELQLEKAQNATTRLNILKSEYRRLNKIAGNSKLTNEEIRQAILSNTNLFTDAAHIASIKEPHVYTADNMEVVTHQVDIQGNFKELITITNQFENKFTDARLSALKFYTVEDNRTKKNSLYGTFYFQNFKKQ
ncbi:MAG TPA: hypothetical protein VD905_01190 [Flavobacteriales bacterium]|nr:hypothetical protein [Flavobacteriales bacterium]